MGTGKPEDDNLGGGGSQDQNNDSIHGESKSSMNSKGMGKKKSKGMGRSGKKKKQRSYSGSHSKKRGHSKRRWSLPSHDDHDEPDKPESNGTEIPAATLIPIQTLNPVFFPMGIIEAQTDPSCLTDRGNIGDIHGKDSFVVTFYYELETIASMSALSVYSVISQPLETGFGDYLVPYLLGNSCATGTSYVKNLLSSHGSESQEKRVRTNLFQGKSQNPHRRKLASSVVGMSSIPIDTIENEYSCQSKVSPDNPCYVMLGQITLYLEHGANRHLSETYHETLVRETMKTAMTNTERFAQTSPLIKRVAYADFSDNGIVASKGVPLVSNHPDGEGEGPMMKVFGSIIGVVFGAFVVVMLLNYVTRQRTRNYFEETESVEPGDGLEYERDEDYDDNNVDDNISDEEAEVDDEEHSHGEVIDVFHDDGYGDDDQSDLY